MRPRAASRGLMASTAEHPPAVRDAALPVEDRIELLRYMVTMRAIEKRALTLYKQDKIPGSFYDGRGLEAIRMRATFAPGQREHRRPADG